MLVSAAIFLTKVSISCGAMQNGNITSLPLLSREDEIIVKMLMPFLNIFELRGLGSVFFAIILHLLKNKRERGKRPITTLYFQYSKLCAKSQ